MVDYLSRHNGVHHWDVLFTRDLNDGALTVFFSFLSIPSKLIGMVKIICNGS